ncbi:PH domain-containing protein [Idiomarina aquatica]|nr:PH domain-containing protein [Idiomarina aquatica]
MRTLLQDNERVLHRSWLSYVIFFEVVLIAVGGVFLNLLFNEEDGLFSLGWLLFVLCDAIKVCLEYTRTRVVITNKRILARHGAFFIKETDTPLTEIRSYYISQSYIGQWFNYGLITINTNAGEYHAIATIYKPYELEQAIKNATRE